MKRRKARKPEGQNAGTQKPIKAENRIYRPEGRKARKPEGKSP